MQSFIQHFSEDWMKLLIALYHNVFNIKFAVLSAVFNSTLVMVLNRRFGYVALISAGFAQGISSFLSTGFTARVVQHFSPIQNPYHSYILGSLIPAAITFGISLAAHLMNGTDNPLLNSCPATLISFTTSFVTNFITRRGYMLPGNYSARTIEKP